MTAVDVAPARADTRTVLHALAVRAGAALVRGTVTTWRYLWTLFALVRLGLLWRSFCGNTGLAVQRMRSDSYGRTRIEVHSVPRVDRYRVTPHGWTARVRLRPGQHLAQYAEACTPLRHTARVQAVKALEIEGQPGFLELRVLRRDPLSRVTERPRELAPGRLACGATENGDPLVLDFTEHPHYLISGATGSGKSMLLSGLQAAIAPTDASMVFWDLKFGVEAEAWRARYTDVCTTQADVLASCGRVLALAEERAAVLRRLGVRNVAEADALGVHLRRVYVLVDEVAELALDHDGEKTADRVLRELLRIVQLVRAMGIHVILCGQRFGSDLGKSVTSIRAQVSGRICLRVNDVQTAEMVLGGLDADDLPRHHRRAEARTEDAGRLLVEGEQLDHPAPRAPPARPAPARAPGRPLRRDAAGREGTDARAQGAPDHLPGTQDRAAAREGRPQRRDARRPAVGRARRAAAAHSGRGAEGAHRGGRPAQRRTMVGRARLRVAAGRSTRAALGVRRPRHGRREGLVAAPAQQLEARLP